MPCFNLDKSEHRAVVRIMNEFLAYVHEGRTVRQVVKLALMRALKKISPEDYRRIIRYMELYE
jgi:hypothetical protein